MQTPIILDVTRTISPKSIATPTGIDRVERAYVRHFLKHHPDALFVGKSGRTHHLIDYKSMSEVFDLVLEGDERSPKQIKGMLGGFWSGLANTVQTRLRPKLPQLPFPDTFHYMNVGQTNLSKPWLAALRKAGAEKIIGLVHDMIPLDHPEFQTSKSVRRFEQRMTALAEEADLIFTNSDFTATRLRHWLETWGYDPPVEVAKLGVGPLADVTARRFDRPAFVTVGTIEPRKNHALLFEVWESFKTIPVHQRPQLHIIGRRGWMNEEVFNFLDNSPLMGRDIFEHGSLSDPEVVSILKGATALLFPSFVEGYGLPLLEAHCVGTPTIVSDIASFREISGGLSLYLNPLDARDWHKEIITQIKLGNAEAFAAGKKPYVIPSWDDHFAMVEQQLSL